MNTYAHSFLTLEFKNNVYGIMNPVIPRFEYLMSCIHRDAYRGEALKAVGELALVIPDDAYSRLDVICSIIKESLNSYR